MNILQEIDSVLYYENIEKFWKKNKFLIIGGLLSVFAITAGFNFYNQKVLEKSQHDTDIIIKLLAKQQVAQTGQQEEVKKAIKEVFTAKAKSALTLELAKQYKIEGNITKYEETLLELQKSEDRLISDISTYMLAEYYLSIDAQKTVDFINSSKLNKGSFKYPLILDIKAMALVNLGKIDEAKSVYITILQDPHLPQNLNTRINAKLGQLK